MQGDSYMKSRLKTLMLLLVMILIIMSLFTACDRKLETFTVTFMVDGEVYQTKEVKSGDGLIPPQIPDKQGYKGEWNIKVFTRVIEDMVVSAVYTPLIHKIIFKAEDDNGTLRTIETKNVTYGNTLTAIPEVPMREGYSGIWNRTSFNNITNDFEVLAIYTKNTYTISFETNGGTVVESIQSEYQTPVEVSTQKDGYIFMGWYKDAEFKTPFSIAFVPAENLVLYAKWALIEFSVRINTQIPELDYTINAAYGSVIENLTEYARTGYKFNGWFSDAERKNPIVFPYIIRQNAAFYADWIRDNRLTATDYSFFHFNESKAEIKPNPDKTLPSNVIIPSVYGNHVVKSIANNAFKDLSIQSVVIPESIVTIGDFAFSTATLSSVSFDNNSRLTVIGAGAFSATSVENIVLPLNLQHIGHGAFYNSESMHFTNIWDLTNLLTIGGLAFSNTLWYNNELNGLSDTIYYINDIVYEAIGNLTYFNLRSTTKSISSQAFMNQVMITEIAIPDSVKHIGGEFKEYGFDIKGAFYGCTQLEVFHVSQNSQLQKTGAGAFAGCNSLSTVAMSSDVALSELFGKEDIEYTYIVNYMGDDYFIPVTLSVIKVFGNSPIKSYAFADLTAVENIYLYGNIEVIDEYAFTNCVNLKNITIPDSVKVIGQYAFSGCADIQNVNIGDSNKLEFIGSYAFENMYSANFNVNSFSYLEVVGDYAFINCYKLQNFVAPNLIEINVGAFSGCKSLKTISLPTNLGCAHDLFENYEQPLDGFYSAANKQIPNTLENVNIVLALDHTVIGEYFLALFSSVKNVSLPEGITSISSYSFAGLNIRAIVIPDSVETIDIAAFFNNEKLSNVTISQSSKLKSISSDVFALSPMLTSIYIPRGVESICLSAFAGCEALESINVDETNEYYYDFEGVLYQEKTLLYYPMNKTDLTYSIKEGTEYIENSAFTSSKLKNLIMNAELISSHEDSFIDCQFDSVTLYSDGNKLTDLFFNVEYIEVLILKGDKISDEFAMGIAIKKVEISEGVTVIGDRAFQNCLSLTEASIPASILRIGKYAFDNCSLLETIDFINLDIIEEIDEMAFENTLWYQNLPDNEIVYIGNIAYTFKGIMDDDFDLIIRDGVTAIADYAFSSFTQINSVTFPSSLRTIGSYAFSGATGISSLVFNEELIEIKEYAFANCNNLFDVTFNDNLEYIGDFCFYNATSLNSITLKEGLKHIGRSAFENNTALSEVSIPSSVTTIGSKAFYNSASLNTIVFNQISNVEDFGEKVFHGTNWFDTANDFVLFNGSILYAYKGTNSQISTNGLSRIMPYAFAGNENIVNVSFANTVESIGKYAFADCVNLETITFTPNGILTHIGDYAFKNCQSLRNFYLPFNLENLDRTVLDGCVSLLWINIENEEINDKFNFINGILYNNDKTQIVYVPMTISGVISFESTITEIPDFALENRTGITTVVFHDGIQRIGDGAFKGCTALSEIVFNSNSMLTHIGAEAFYECDLVEIILPRRIEFIGKNAFYKSDSINRILTLQSDNPPVIIDLDPDAFAIFVPRNSLALYQECINSNIINPSRVIVEFVIDNRIHSATEIRYGEKISLIPSVPSLTGFTGVWRQNELEKIYSDNEFNSIYQDVRINAVYTRNTYSINYYYDELIETVSYLYDDALSLLQYQLEGKQFLFWTEDINSLSQFNSAKMPARDIELYAVMYSFVFEYDSVSDWYIISPSQNNAITPENLILPSQYNGKDVAAVKAAAFENNVDINIVTLPSTIITIAENAFKLSSVKQIILDKQSELTNINNFAFYMSSLQYINLNHNLEGIGQFAFASSDITQLNLIIDISRIGENAFADCSKLETVTITSPETVLDNIITMSKGLFQQCVSLTTVNLPNQLTVVEEMTFMNCNSLSNINLSNIKTIHSAAFQNCNNLEYISLDEIVTIADNAFNNCSSLKSLNLDNNETLNYIGENAFHNCNSLKYFALPASVKQVLSGAFVNCDLLEYFIIKENGNGYDGSMGLTISENVIDSNVDIYVSVALEMNQTKWAPNNVYLYRDIVDDFIVDINNNIILYIGRQAQVTVPERINDDLINGIEQNTFINADQITTLIFTSQHLINNLDNSVFYHLKNLEQFISPTTVNGVLYNQNGTGILAYPVNKDSIVYEIKSNITSIANYAFYGANNLESITLKGAVPPQIGTNTFGNLCASFKFYVPATAINTYKNAPVWSQFSNQIYTDYIGYNDFLLIAHPEGLEIAQYHGTAQNVTIPLSINGKDIVSIGDYAFYRTNLKTINIPTNIKYIGKYAFAESYYLETVYLSSNVRTLGEYAFAHCQNLINFNFNNRVQLTEIRPYTFLGNTALETVNIPYNVSIIGERAFMDCSSLNNVILPSNTALTTIGSYAFQNCISLTNININISKNLLTIREYAFVNCSSLKALSIPESLTSIKSYAFYNCSQLESLVFVGQSKLIEIGDYAFVGCNRIKKLTVPASVVKIGERAFYNNNLTQLIFNSGSKLNEIGRYAFANSSSIEQVHLYGNINIIREGAFLNAPKLRWMKIQTDMPPILESNVWDSKLRIYVPDLALNSYLQSWSLYSGSLNSLNRIAGDYSYINFGNGVEIFQYMGYEEDIILPQTLNGRNVLSIGSYAFSEEIKNIIIPNTVTTLKAAAFNGARLQSIELSKFIQTIENNPFTNCRDLNEIVLDADNPYFSVLDSVLFNKNKTRLISYPNAITKFGYIYNVPLTVTHIGIDAFRGADKLKVINIPQNIISIGKNAFMDCVDLFAINFDDATMLDFVGEKAFDGTLWYQGKSDGVVYLYSQDPSISGLTVYGYKGEMNGPTQIYLDEDSVSVLPFAFRNQLNLTFIEIPSSVTKIGESILSGCSNITQITMPGGFILGYLFGTTNFAGAYIVYNNQKDTYYYAPDNLTVINIAEGSEIIADYAFNNTHNIVTINIPNSVRYIGRYAFYSNSSAMKIQNVIFESVYLSSLEVIGSYSFRACRELRNLILPNSLRTINAYAFEGATRLVNLTLESASGGGFSNLSYIGNSSFANCSSLRAISIPSNVKYISAKAFFGCTSLNSVIFAPDGELLEIGAQAFMNCSSIVTIETSSKLSIIGDRAFYNCISLDLFNYVRSSESLTYIGYEVFNLTPFYNMLLSRPENQNTILYFSKVAYAYNGIISSGTLLELRSNTVSLSPYLFANRNNIFVVTTVAPDVVNHTTILLNSSLKIIGKNAFANIGYLGEVTLPSGLTTIEADAFRNCNTLISFSFENIENIEYIGQNAFHNTPWYNTIFNNQEMNTVIYIGRVAYKYKGTIAPNTELSLREDTVCITPYAFEAQQNLLSIQLPAGIKHISQFIFGNHLAENEYNLQTIYIDKEALTIENIAGIFTSASKVIINSMPTMLKGSVYYTYQITTGNDTVTITESIDIMDLIIILKEEYTLPQIYVPGAYYYDYLIADGWSDLTRFLIPYEGITDNFVYVNSEDGEGVDIVYYIGNSTNITIPEELDGSPVIGIRSYAFNTTVEQITLNSQMKFIYDYGFANSIALTNIELPLSLKLIGDYAFANCVSLESVHIKSNVVSIGSYAFYNCQALSVVNIDSGIMEIKEYAFAECISLESITIPHTVEVMGNYVFNECLNLKVLVMRGIPPLLGNSGLYYRSNADFIIFVTDNDFNSYANNFYWKKYLNKMKSISLLLTHISEKNIYLHDLADLLLNDRVYETDELVTTNFALTASLTVYIADSATLSYQQLIDNYQISSITATTVRIPDFEGEYSVYIVANQEIISIGKNVITVI